MDRKLVATGFYDVNFKRSLFIITQTPVSHG
jgi:hypothetical protein